MTPKVFNAPKNLRALMDMARQQAKAKPSKSAWTFEKVNALTDEAGDDIQCPWCGCVVRECIGEGGPGQIRGWKFQGGRWVHNCGRRRHEADAVGEFYEGTDRVHDDEGDPRQRG